MLHVACLIFVYTDGRLAMPRVRHGFKGTPLFFSAPRVSTCEQLAQKENHNMVHGIAKQILRVLALALLLMPIQSKASEGLRNNDDFSDARAIVGEMGTLRTSNRGATAVEGEEELHRSNKTLWYKWTAPANGIMTIDTLGSGFDTILAAYTGEDGASISGLSQLVFNDTGPGFAISESQISFAATEGTTYYIVVGGWYDAVGDIVLNWDFFSGTFEMKVVNGVVTGYRGTCPDILTAADWPEGVTAVAANAFYGTLLESVYIPASVTNIEYGAFGYCSNLATVTFAGDKTGIDINESAFAGTPYEESLPFELIISDGVLTGFMGSCPSELTIPDHAKAIGSDVFYLSQHPSAANVERVVFNEGLESVGDRAFYNCYNLREIVLPSTVTNVDYSAFAACYAVTNIVLNEGLLSIKGGAFGQGTTIDITLPTTVREINREAFSGTEGTVTVHVPWSLYGILESGETYQEFWRGGSDSYVVTTRVDVVFYGEAPTFYAVTLNTNGGDDLESARKSVVDGRVIGTLPIPTRSGYVFLGWFTAAEGGDAVTAETVVTGDMTLYAHWEEIVYSYNYIDNGDGTVTLSCYDANGYWVGGVSPAPVGEFAVPDEIDGKRVVAIGDSCFSSCYDLTGVIIPDSVMSIGYEAFSYCDSLSSVAIGSGVTNIGQYAFAWCDGLTDVAIPDSVASIDEFAFYGCGGLTSFSVGTENANYKSVNGLLLSKDGKTLVAGVSGNVTIPDTVTSIGGRAFAGRSGLLEILIPNSVTNIGDYAFGWCHGLATVAIPDSVLSVREGAFQSCGSLASVAIGRGLTNIGQYAFGYCSSLDEVTFAGDGSEIDIADTAFVATPYDAAKPFSFIINEYGNLVGIHGTAPENLVLSDYLNGQMLTGIGSSALSGEAYDMSSVTNIVIPEGVQFIDAHAFYGCAALESVALPTSLQRIYYGAFDNCTSLRSLWIPSGVTYVGDEFYGCENLTVYAPDTLEGTFSVPDGLDIEYYHVPRSTITFDANGGWIWDDNLGDVATLDRTVLEGDAIGTLPAPYKYDEYRFIGWFDEDDNEVTVETVPAGDMTVVAKWAEQATVSFGANGGYCDYDALTFFEGDVIDWLPVAWRDGYFFLGWFTAAEGGDEVTAETVVTGDVTLYAHWTESPFYATGGDAPWLIDGDGSWRSGAITDSQSTWVELAVTNAPCLVSFKWKTSSEDGYDILHCYLDGDEIVSAISGVMDEWVNVSFAVAESGDHSVQFEYTKDGSASNGEDCGWVKDFALIEAETRALTLDANGGWVSGGAAVGMSVINGCAIGQLPVPVWTGEGARRFVGWFTMVDGGDEVLATTIVTEEVIAIYAHWRDIIPPSNDNFADAIEIHGANGAVNGTNIDATTEDYVCAEEGDVWWKWTAPASGKMSFEVRSSRNMGFSIGILTGNTLDSLDEIACEDDDDYEGLCRVEFDAEAGTTYHILVGGSGATHGDGQQGLSRLGDFTLSWRQLLPPENDAFANATVISGESGKVIGTNMGAGIEEGEPLCAYAYSTATAWWSWTAPKSGSFVFDTNGSDFDTVLGVYTGNAVDGLEIVDENDDDDNGSTSTIIFDAVAGKTYYIAVGGCESCIGNIVLNWNWNVPPVGEWRFDITENGEAIITGNSVELVGDVVIPASVTVEEDDGEGGVREVECPVVAVGEMAFYCSGLASVTMPNSVTNIDAGAFYGCSGLASVTIPDSVTSIGSYAFSGCASLTNVAIPASVTSIGGGAFSECDGLLSFYVTESNAGYKTESGILLSKDGKVLVAVPGGMTDVAIPASVTSIGPCAFAGCIGLTSVVIPASVTNIGDFAFSNCSSLTRVTIPDSVINIGDGAFAGCNGLADNDGFVIIRDVFYSYCGDAVEIVIPDSVTRIGANAFDGCGSLTSVTILGSVTNIGVAAFMGCSSLTIVTIPGSVTSISDYAFFGCDGLRSVTIPSGVTNIGEWTFFDCDGLTSVTIPGSVTSIGDSAFFSCDGLTSVTMPGSVTSIGSDAFSWCFGLTSVYTSVGDADRVKGLMTGSGFDVSGVSFIELDMDTLPKIGGDVDAATVNAVIDGIRFADATVKDAIGGSATEYNAFKTWAGGVKGTAGDALAGEAAVVANEHAAAAYLLGSERLFENEPTIEIGGLAIAEGESAGTTAMTVAVTVKDGASAVAVDAAKVAAMFEATGDLGDWTGAAKLTPTVTTSGTDASGKMTFVVTPGDGTAAKAFLRIRK